MLNKVILTGRFATEPQLREISERSKCCFFSVAVNRPKKEQTDFFSCVAWNKTAENIMRYCHKGSLVNIEGTLRSYSYLKDNRKIYGTEISVQRIYFIDTKSKNPEDEKISENDLIDGIDEISDEEFEQIFADEDTMF